MVDLGSLNPQQREAVRTTEGPVLILAGAGTGKTRVITTRIGYLIDRGVPPGHILAVTFTNKAAREMQERVRPFLRRPDPGEEKPPRPTISTFHSLCVRILRQHIHLLGYKRNFVITGIYTVRVSSNNCAATSAGIAITVLPYPQPPRITKLSGTSPICAGDSITMSSSATTGNQWFRNGVAIDGATGQVYAAKETGAYSVKTTLSNGCQSNASVELNVTVITIQTPAISIAAGAAGFCNGDSVTLSSSSATGNQWIRNNVAISGATGQEYIAKQSGVYTVQSTEGSCQSLVSVALNVTANILPSKPVVSTTGSSLSTANGFAVYKWYFNNVLIAGAVGRQINVTQSGLYKVEVTDNNGCSAISDEFNFVYTALNDITLEGYSIQFYPNPVIDEMIVKVSSANVSSNKLSLSVAGLNGKILQTVSLKVGTNRVSLKQYPSGIYSLIVTKGNYRKMVKILKTL